MDRLKEGLISLGLLPDKKKIKLLKAYLSEIELWNPHYSLIAPGEDLISRHILDSLAGLPIIRNFHPKTLADLGSGAGLPGIPLGIFLEDTPLTLIERSAKRADFLRHVVLKLGLCHVRVEEKTIEEISHRFAMLSFRALSGLNPSFLRSLTPLLEKGAPIVAYKGRKDRVEEELAAVAASITRVDVHRLDVPGIEEERHLVVLRLS